LLARNANEKKFSKCHMVGPHTHTRTHIHKFIPIKQSDFGQIAFKLRLTLVKLQ